MNHRLTSQREERLRSIEWKRPKSSACIRKRKNRPVKSSQAEEKIFGSPERESEIWNFVHTFGWAADHDNSNHFLRALHTQRETKTLEDPAHQICRFYLSDCTSMVDCKFIEPKVKWRSKIQYSSVFLQLQRNRSGMEATVPYITWLIRISTVYVGLWWLTKQSIRTQFSQAFMHILAVHTFDKVQKLNK